MSSNNTKTSYHHGELEKSLLSAAHIMLKEGGIESLSLRKLAEKVGVSRTAPYHHFQNKNELLCALAADGFNRKTQTINSILNDKSLSPKQALQEFVYSYVENAAQEPELYDLMFGRPIWKSGQSNETLQHKAFPAFQLQLDLVKHWQQQGILDANENSLRLSQVMWSTLHGISRLIIDGIYSTDATNKQHIKEVCDCAINQFMVHS